MNRRRFLQSSVASAALAASAYSGARAPRRSGFRPTTRILGFDRAKLAEIERVFEEHVEAGRVAGVSARILRRGKVAFEAAIGHRDREADRPMTPDTIVRIASMTKPITSAAVMKLVEDGSIDLDDPLSHYLREFAHPTVLRPGKPKTEDGPAFEIVSSDKEITIRQLLTHTSGLTYRFRDQPHVSDFYVKAGISDGLAETWGTIGENVWRLAQTPLLHPPGTAWEYGLSTDVLGRVVEVVSGKTLEADFQSRLFRPLGMEDTHFLLPAEKRDRLAAVYQAAEDGPVTRMPDLPIQDGPLVYSATYPVWDDSLYHSGGAGLVSTLGDYGRFLTLMLQGGESQGRRWLSPKTVSAMTRNQIGDLAIEDWGHGDRFGFGFGVETTDNGPWSAGSYSWGGFFATDFWVDPAEELIGILFTQTYPSGGFPLRERFRTLTYEALHGA